MKPEKGERPGDTSGPFEKSAETTDQSDSNPRRRRVGCIFGCVGYGHDDDCPTRVPIALPSQRCSAGYACWSMTFAALDGLTCCPCDQARRAVGADA